MSKIQFQPLRINDLRILHRWLNTDHIIQWYGKKSFSFEEVEKHYLPRIKGNDPTNSYIILFQNNPIGYIQMYLVEDDPELKEYVSSEGSAGLDLFVGESNYLGRGLGSEIMREFLKQVVFNQPGISTCIVDPLPTNSRMIHVNEKVGFKYLTTTQGEEPKYLMTIHKEEII